MRVISRGHSNRAQRGLARIRSYVLPVVREEIEGVSEVWSLETGGREVRPLKYGGSYQHYGYLRYLLSLELPNNGPDRS